MTAANQPGGVIPPGRLKKGTKIPGPSRTGAIVHLCYMSQERPVVFFGMSQSAHVESDVVKRGNRDKGGVTAIINDERETSDLLRQLQDEERTRQLIDGLRLSDHQARALVELIEQQSGGRERALLLRLARVYAEAERGCRTMARVVLSGESLAAEVFSRERGNAYASLDFQRFVQLRRIFPVASGQVRHVLMAACSCGHSKDIEVFLEMFPKAQTIMAYAGKGPNGPMARSDIAYWEAHTKTELIRSLAPIPKRRGDRGGEIRVSTWSVAEGYRGELKPLSRLMEAVERDEPLFKERLLGTPEPSDDPDFGVVHDYYRSLTELVGRKDYIDESGRAKYVAQREQAMRLRYWRIVRENFASEHADELRRGYNAAGLKIPDFSQLGRADLLAQIRDLEVAQARLRNGAAALAQVMATLRLLRGLEDLDPGMIPRRWL